ncbi:hypothetical protein H920_06879 [Fukomys damarensis]|uniref:Uncharacterized protein n=1 Tax=Fukomys damarensis TaxID=885580 RepID=A0A091DN46_FUKDA|nr:hypothetical protein H920_06879 [Fukomys damarensis]
MTQLRNGRLSPRGRNQCSSELLVPFRDEASSRSERYLDGNSNKFGSVPQMISLVDHEISGKRGDSSLRRKLATQVAVPFPGKLRQLEQTVRMPVMDLDCGYLVV